MVSNRNLAAAGLVLTGWLAACPPEAAVCTTATDCASDRVCVEQVCRQVCNSSPECADDEVCSQGACLPATAVTPDASGGEGSGIDGSGIDGGGIDSGAPDRAGADAGAVDATSADRVLQDSTAVDQQRADRSGTDLSAADAGDPCAGADCSGHGHCTAVTGAAQCQCDPGYDGAACEICATGFQDNDRNGSCQDDCDTAALLCVTHQLCDDSSGVAGCVCVTGYTDRGGGCVWNGGPVDPGFQQAAAWSVSGSALVDTAATGADEPGAGVLSIEATCGGGAIWQTFEMPDVATAEPLLLRFRSIGDADLFNGCWNTMLSVAIDGGWYLVPLSSFWRANTICLGERGYGGTVEVRFAPSAVCDCAALQPDQIPWFSVDDVVIEPDAAGECPAVGAVRNGDFEQGTNGWGLSTSGGVAEVVVGSGTGSSLALHLATDGRCDSASATGRFSPPIAAPATDNALQIRVNGSAGDWLDVQVDSMRLAALPGRGAFEARRVCLLEALGGLVHDLRFALDSPGGLCADPYLRDFVVDDLELVHEQACALDPYLVDGGFELLVDAPNLAQHWSLMGENSGVAQLEENAAVARSGNVALRLRVASPCYDASAMTLAAVPPPQAGAGPALTFWYRAPSVAHGTLSFYTSSGGGGTLAAAGSYLRITQCLDASDAGRIIGVIFARAGGNGTCANGYPEEIAHIDDVALVNDPGCP